MTSTLCTFAWINFNFHIFICNGCLTIFVIIETLRDLSILISHSILLLSVNHDHYIYIYRERFFIFVPEHSLHHETACNFTVQLSLAPFTFGTKYFFQSGCDLSEGTRWTLSSCLRSTTWICSDIIFNMTTGHNHTNTETRETPAEWWRGCVLQQGDKLWEKAASEKILLKTHKR